VQRILITILILVISHFLATRERAWLGAIVPTIYVIAIGILINTTKLKLISNDILPFFVGLIVFLGIWASGRESFKQKRKKELDKIEKDRI